jgi:hypothetical protein
MEIALIVGAEGEYFFLEVEPAAGLPPVLSRRYLC